MNLHRWNSEPSQYMWEWDPFIWHFCKPGILLAKQSLNPGQMAKSLFLHLSMLLVVKRQVVWGRLDACLSSLNWTLTNWKLHWR